MPGSTKHLTLYIYVLLINDKSFNTCITIYTWKRDLKLCNFSKVPLISLKEVKLIAIYLTLKPMFFFTIQHCTFMNMEILYIS